MEYRQLGNSELNVSEISLGSWLTYSGGVDRQEAVACLRKAFEVGINFLDTANVYGTGAAEMFLGEKMGVFFSERLRSDRVLSAVQQLKSIAANIGLSMPQLALAWVLPDARVSSAIIGASRPAQVVDNAGASNVKLTDEVLKAIDEVLAPAI